MVTIEIQDQFFEMNRIHKEWEKYINESKKTIKKQTKINYKKNTDNEFNNNKCIRLNEYDKKMLIKYSKECNFYKEEIELKDNYSKAKDIDLENVKIYFNYLLENSKNDIAIGYKKVAEKLGLTQGEGLRIFKHLKDNGYLVTVGRITKIQNNKKYDF